MTGASVALLNIMRKLLLFSFIAGIPLAAASPDYFPLHVGNQWVYRQGGAFPGEPVVVDIPRSEVFEGRSYSLVRGFGESNAWLRMDENGTLHAYDPDRRQELVWAAFATPAGGTYRTAINQCNNMATVESRDAKASVPAGEFGNALEIRYPAANCADAGLTSEKYLPWIGLVERTSLTIAGPRTWKLSYARVGGVTVLSEPEHSFSLTLDRAEYSDPSPVLTGRMTLRSTQPDTPRELMFPSGQRFDLEIRNEAGDLVFLWSEGKFFTLALGSERITGEKNWVAEVPLVRDRVRLPAGNYSAEGWLTTMEGKRYAARVGFAVRPVR